MDLTIVNAITRLNAKGAESPSKIMPENDENSFQDIRLDSKTIVI